MNVLTRTAIPLTAALALTLSACADGDTKGGSKPDARQQTTSTSAAPLEITDHVLPADALPGLTADGRAKEEDLADFAEAHDKTVAELRRSGFETASSLFFSGRERDFGISVAVQYADEAAADAEADRLFRSNTEGDDSIEVRDLELDIPEVRAASLHGAEGGTDYTGVEIVFVEGDVLHEVFVIGESARFDLDGVVASVTDLYDEVAGRPTA